MKLKLEIETGNIKILDKYILKQVVEMFLMGVLVFTSIIFASDTFMTLIRQISKYGIPFKIAFILVILTLPSVFVMTIPMGVLLSTVMTINKMSLASELTVMRACGIGFNRMAQPIFIFAVIMCLFSFFINEAIVPVMTQQSKDLALWAFSQKNIPEGKHDFTFQEINADKTLKRIFYVESCQDKQFRNVTVLDMAKKDTIHVLQAQSGGSSTKGWIFNNGIVYSIGSKDKLLNATYFGKTVAQFGVDLKKELNRNVSKEHNFIQLCVYLARNKDVHKRRMLVVDLFDKIALPLTTIVLVLVAFPLAITPPRVRYNRGFLFSILILFAYYLIRALSLSFGEAGTLHPFFAAFLPNIILTIVGTYLYYRKVFTIT